MKNPFRTTCGRQQEFESLLHQAMTILNNDEARGAVLYCVENKEGTGVLAGSVMKGNSYMGHALGELMGILMNDDGAGAKSIREGVNDHLAGSANVKVMSPKQALSALKKGEDV